MKENKVHIVLIGDSIFDNASYVEDGESVSELLTLALPKAKVTLLAVDGDVTTDVSRQLDKFPHDATSVIVSCGGNDALKVINILEKEASTVGDALTLLYGVREEFRTKYIAMLNGVMGKFQRPNICTIYNKIPGISERALTALALFNEIILEESILRSLNVIDLRVIVNEALDYSSISPIEPSKSGGQKIVSAIIKSV